MERNRNRNHDCNRKRMRNPEAFPASSECKAIIRKLFSSQYKKLAWIFYDPIDASYLGLYDYYTIVKKPMDLTTIRNRLQAGLYKNADEFRRDMCLIFDNTYLYTTPDHVCYQMAKKLQKIFEEMFSELVSTDKSDTMIEPTTSHGSEKGKHPTISAAPNKPQKLRGVSKRSASGPQFETPLANEPIELPWTDKENSDLRDWLQVLKGEVRHRVIHIIKQMENLPIINGELEFNIEDLKTQTKCTIVKYLTMKNYYAGRRTRSKF